MLDFESFHLAFKTTLDRFAPLKRKVVRNNNQPFMTKTLRKAIMERSKLRNKFNKERKAKNYCKQQRLQTTTKLLFKSFERIQNTSF